MGWNSLSGIRKLCKASSHISLCYISLWSPSLSLLCVLLLSFPFICSPFLLFVCLSFSLCASSLLYFHFITLFSFCLFVFPSLYTHLLSIPFLSFPFLSFVINLPPLSPCPLPLGLVGLWLATISGFLTGCVSVFKCCCGKQHYTTLFFLPSVWLQ